MGIKDTILEDEIEEVEEKESPLPGEIEHESVEDSVRLALEDLEKESGGEEGGAEESEAAAIQSSTDSAQQVEKDSRLQSSQVTKEKEEVFELGPPERLNAQQRAVYKRSSPAMKRVFHEIVSDLESRTHKAFHQEKTELGSKLQKYRDLDDILDPYLPEFEARGHTKTSAISELLQIHRGLANPETKNKTYEELGAKIGYAPMGNSNGHISTDGISEHPIIKNLIEENKRLRGMVEPVHNQIQANTQSEQERVRREMDNQMIGLSEEVDQSGKQMYPKLQDSQYFERLRPLVISRMQSDPGIDFIDALRMEYNIVEKRFGYLQNRPNQTKPSPQKQTRIVTPPLSVRGKTTSVSNLPAYDEDIKPGETAEESTRIAVERLMRGVH